MRNGVAIQYGDVAPEAKENFNAVASESEFDTLEQLKQYNVEFLNYGNPCELYSVPLDGETLLMPEDVSGINIGLVSESITESDGTFDEPIVLTLTSEGQYSSIGLTLIFDEYEEIFANDVNIKWYRVIEGVETLLADEDFEPDSGLYFCNNNVENYNKLVITFKGMNMPENRLRLRAIDYGYGTMFYGDELRDVKLIQEIDPISTQISINTVDFTIDSQGSIEYDFQQKQPVSVYFNGRLRATTFVKKAKREAKFLWEVSSEDYIGLMDSTPFAGGMYFNKNAADLLEEIFTVAKVPYNISAELQSETVSGHIEYTTCRDALMQVCFALMAVADTSNSNVVEVYRLDDTVTQTIPLRRIMRGQNFEDDEKVTAVEVVAHQFTAIGGADGIEVYNAHNSGQGQGIFVKFSEPLHDVRVTQGTGTVVEAGVNYAIINAGENCVVRGAPYEHLEVTHRKDAPVVLASQPENVVTIEKAMLVSNDNVDNILNNCYNWYRRTRTTNLKIVEGKTVTEHGRYKYGQANYGEITYGEEVPPTVVYDEPVDVGETIRAETEYLGTVEGIVIEQTYNLNGGIIVKDTVMR